MAEQPGYWDRGNQRWSRRSALKTVGLGSAGLALVGVLGCGKNEQSAQIGTESVATAPTPRRGGSINRLGGPGGLAYDTRGVGFDPHRNVASTGLTYRLFYQGLLGYNPKTYAVEPELAQKWEQPSELEYLLRLRPGVKWHDKPPVSGRDLTIDDVIFNLNRANDTNPRNTAKTALSTVDKFEPVGRDTIRIVTKQPDAVAMVKLAADNLLMMAPEIVEKANDRFTTADTAVGTGAFVLQSVEEGVNAEYVRNPTYWKPDRPFLDKIQTPSFASKDLGWAAFLASQLQVVPVPGSEVKRYVAGLGAGVEPLWFAPPLGSLFVSNVAKEPLNDQRVWKALRLLIDHEEQLRFAEDVTTGRARNASIFPPAFEQWDLTHEEYFQYLPWKKPKDDAARQALALLSAAGYSSANPLRFKMLSSDSPDTTKKSELLSSDWARLSGRVIEAGIDAVPVNVFTQRRVQRAFDYASSSVVPSVVDPDSPLREVYHSKGASNFSGHQDATLDKLIEDQGRTFDAQRRKAQIRDIILYMIENSPSVMPSGEFDLNAVAPKVRGFTPERFIMGHQYEGVWLDT
jgi:peptide/nickel transport system substrate-binding protein